VLHSAKGVKFPLFSVIYENSRNFDRERLVGKSVAILFVAKKIATGNFATKSVAT
jgi:hypothetical protein